MTGDRVAMITGSTSGIGLASAHALARDGCDIILHGLEELDVIKEIINSLKQKYDVKASYIKADLLNSEEIKRLAINALETWGRVDILINNAGVKHVDPIEDYPEDKWHEAVAVNMTAPFLLCQQLIPSMKKNGWGRIINIVSVVGVVASVNRSAYVASKHGLSGLTKATALELAAHGVTCNGICPGWVATEFNTKGEFALKAKEISAAVQDAAQALLNEKQPSKQFITATEVADLVAFLCSDSARQITGALLNIDGGWSAQ